MFNECLFNLIYLTSIEGRLHFCNIGHLTDALLGIGVKSDEKEICEYIRSNFDVDAVARKLSRFEDLGP